MATATRSPVGRLIDPEGKASPRELMLTAVTWLLAIIAVAAVVVDSGAVAAGAGAVACVTGGAAQMYSSTTHSRWLIMPAWVLAGVALLVGLLR